MMCALRKAAHMAVIIDIILVTLMCPERGLPGLSCINGTIDISIL